MACWHGGFSWLLLPYLLPPDAYNTWTNNAASGGFAGFSFPKAPRPIKEHRRFKKADGFPFNPSERPFVLFRGNTVHSTGYNWEHAGGVYFGGMIFYKTDPSDNQVKVCCTDVVLL